MTVSTTASTTILGGNGATTSFNFDFIAVSASDLEIIYTNGAGLATTLPPTSYSVFLNPIVAGQIWSVGGTVTYPLSGSPLANGETLTISRILSLTQTITIANQGDFAPQVIEEMGDTLEMQIQQVAARTGQFRGTWLTATNYNFGDFVQDGANGSNSDNFYMCIISNTSGVWINDLASGDWTLAIQSAFPTTTLPLAATNGGTGTGSYNQGDIIYANTATTLAKLPKTAVATRYLSNTGTSNNPAWAQVDMATGITGFGVNVAAFLATPSSANLAAAVTDKTGTGALVFAGGNIGAGTATTPSAGDNSTKIATTAYVDAVSSAKSTSGKSVTSNATPTDIAGLSWALDVGTYIVDFSGYITCNTSGGFALRGAFSGTATGKMYRAIATDTGGVIMNWLTTTTPFTSYATSSVTQVSVSGQMVFVVTVAGTFTLQLGQGSSNINATAIADGQFNATVKKAS